MSNGPLPGRARKHVINAVLLVAIIGLLAVMYRSGVLDRYLPEKLNSHRVAAGTPTTSSATPTTTPTVMIPDVVLNLSQPFVGTPAAGWADGEAGIVAPAAAPVGNHPAGEVAELYAKVRQAVITARLDRKVIEGHETDRLLALLAPRAQDQIKVSLADSRRSALVATSIADGFRLLPVSPKVSGRMWAEQRRDGSLVAHTDYVIAYAFDTDRPAEMRGAMDIVVVDRMQVSYEMGGAGRPPADQGLWIGESSGYSYSISCAAIKRGQLAPSYSDRAFAGNSGGDGGLAPNDYFDPAAPMPVTETCR